MFSRKPKNREYKSWHGYLLLAVVIVAVVLGLFQKFGSPRVDDYLPITLNSYSCEASGGDWNDCKDWFCPDDAVCESCRVGCVCEINNDCPFGYACGDDSYAVRICESL